MQHHPSEVKQHLCPKPRRLCPSLPEFFKPKPLSCSLHSSSCQHCSEGRSGVITIVDKVQPIEGGTIESMWYVGSPPRRTGNPLVHDLRFMHCFDRLTTLRNQGLIFTS